MTTDALAQAAHLQALLAEESQSSDSPDSYGKGGIARLSPDPCVGVKDLEAAIDAYFVISGTQESKTTSRCTVHIKHHFSTRHPSCVMCGMM